MTQTVQPTWLLQGSQGPEVGQVFVFKQIPSVSWSPGAALLWFNLTCLGKDSCRASACPSAAAGRLPRLSGRSSRDLHTSPSRKCWGRSWEDQVVGR